MIPKVPIGIDNFRDVIEGGYVYVDKTLFIEEVLEQPARVQLITRPRRFGKTLNLSMLAHFFDQRGEGRRLFRGLAIESRPSYGEQGRYPVLLISFKDLKAATYPAFLDLFSQMIQMHYREHTNLVESLSDFEREDFQAFARGEERETRLVNAIFLLTRWLHQHHGKRVILLIDEYDSPIHEGYAAGYFEEVVTFMRGLLGKALKGNDGLEKAVLTGILRVAKESIFSDLNNIDVFTLIDQAYADHFGFTEMETRALLHEHGLDDHIEKVGAWYNGYQIGGKTIYNPWSLIQFLKSTDHECRPYWVNTSANLLVREQLLHADEASQDALKSLMAGGEVKTTVRDQTVFGDLNRDATTLWSFLLFSGYLTVVERWSENHQEHFALKVPNLEVLVLYREIIQSWLRREFGEPKTKALLEAMIEGDGETFGSYLSELVEAILSYYDTAGKAEERVYHAFVLGLLAHLTNRYIIKSNRESGMGRYDVLMLPRHKEDRGIIMEFKRTDQPEQLEAALTAAHQQIETRNYVRELQAAGIQTYSVIAVAFSGKHVKTSIKNI